MGSNELELQSYSYKQARYDFEHRAFRNMFLNAPSAVFGYLKRGGDEAFRDIYHFLLRLHDSPAIYGYDDCASVEVLDDMKCIHISLAEPMNKLECTDIVLYYNAETAEYRYLTVEYDVLQDTAIFVPCEWIDKNTHSSVGMFRHKRNRVLKMLYRGMFDNNRDYQAVAYGLTDSL